MHGVIRRQNSFDLRLIELTRTRAVVLVYVLLGYEILDHLFVLHLM